MIINQTLHGYSKGHGLLASSIVLSKESQREMLIISDLSGSNMPLGFTKYLTGYPLGKDKIYAFSKTWYASEMKRPGCVWTHTLLINFNDLNSILTMDVLLPCFRRPQKTFSFESYENSISIDCFENNTYLNNFSDPNKCIREIAQPILLALYEGKAENPVIVEANEPKEYERLVLALWSQQWPSLRKSFYFCTGSISHRSSMGKNFSLQIVPSKNVRQFERASAGFKIVNINKSIHSERSFPKWVEFAADDVVSKNNQKLWPYFQGVTDESTSHPDSFSKLITIFNEINDVNSKRMSVDRLFETIYKAYPLKKEAAKLKKSLFGFQKEACNEPLIKIPKVDAIFYIATTQYNKMFSKESYDLRTAAKTLWDENK